MSACCRCAFFLKGGVNGSSSPPWHQKREDEVGLCRRYPPHWLADPITEDGGAYCFPAVHEGHLCGEWSASGPWEDTTPC